MDDGSPDVLEQPEPSLEGEDPTKSQTDGATVEAPPRYVKVTFHPDGVQIEWTPAVGPVDILGAAGYLEWQAKFLLDSEMAQRVQMQRVVLPGDHLGPGGQRRT